MTRTRYNMRWHLGPDADWILGSQPGKTGNTIRDPDEKFAGYDPNPRARILHDAAFRPIQSLLDIEILPGGLFVNGVQERFRKDVEVTEHLHRGPGIRLQAPVGTSRAELLEAVEEISKMIRELGDHELFLEMSKETTPCLDYRFEKSRARKALREALKRANNDNGMPF